MQYDTSNGAVLSDLRREVFMTNIAAIEPVNQQPDDIQTSGSIIGEKVQMNIQFELDNDYDEGTELTITFDDD